MRLRAQGLASRLMGQQLAACLLEAGEPLMPAAVLRSGAALWAHCRAAALAQELSVFRAAGGKARSLRLLSCLHNMHWLTSKQTALTSLQGMTELACTY